MKKTPRKFSEGGKAAPASASQPKPQPKPQAKPQDKKDSTPSWVTNYLTGANQDAKTKIGHDAATADDRLKKYKAGGKVKKFSTGEEVEGRFSKSDPDIYERARAYVARKNSEEAGEAGSIKEPKVASKPKAVSKPASKPEPKAAPSGGRSGGAGATEPSVPYRDSEAAPAPFKSVTERARESRESVRRGSDSTTDTRSVNEKIKQAVEENPKTAAALGLAASFIPVAGTAMRGVQAARAAMAARRAAAAKETMRKNIKPARDLDEERMAGEGGPNFKKGGMAKYAKGGGIEAKGKTKGTVVKMAAGGSVKGWGIARGSKACKMK
jgi:hypothetical protein